MQNNVLLRLTMKSWKGTNAAVPSTSSSLGFPSEHVIFVFISRSSVSHFLRLPFFLVCVCSLVWMCVCFFFEEKGALAKNRKGENNKTDPQSSVC